MAECKNGKCLASGYAVIGAESEADTSRISNFPQRDFWGVNEISFVPSMR